MQGDTLVSLISAIGALMEGYHSYQSTVLHLHPMFYVFRIMMLAAVFLVIASCIGWHKLYCRKADNEGAMWLDGENKKNVLVLVPLHSR